MNKPKKPFDNDLYDKRNYALLLTGVLIVIVGYICLGWKPKDGTLTMVVAPFLLVIGYCVIIPVSLFLRPKKERSDPGRKA